MYRSWLPKNGILALVTPNGYAVEHMFVLGIDPGLTRTGYGVIASSGASERAVAAGVIYTEPGEPMTQRLAELARDLREVVAEHQPAAAAIEQVFLNNNRQTAMAVARASGVALLVLAEAGVDVAEYTPSAVKMALTGSGTADKVQIQRVIAMRLGLTTPPDPADAADALAVALCHVQHGATRAS